MVRLILRDTREAMVSAWEAAFLDVPHVEIGAGDVCDRRAAAYVSPANSFGFMDGGVDAVYLRAFGIDLQDRVRDRILRCYDGELPVGSAILVRIEGAGPQWLICAPTMRVPQDVSGTVNAYLAFRAALRMAEECSIPSMLSPGLCTGTGGMPVQRAARQMRVAYDSVAAGWRPPATLDEVMAWHRELFA